MSKYRSTFLLFLILILPIAILSVQAQGAPPEQRTEWTKDQQSTKVSGDLVALQKEYTAFQQANSQEAFQPSNALLRGTAGHVVIDATAAADADTLQADLEALGLENGATFERIVSGLLPIVFIDDLDSLDSLNFARPAYAATRVGLVDSQADAAMRSDDARLTFGVDGTGITVGTLSDSYNCQSGAAGDVISGDLPSGIVVLEEEAGCGSGSDEGRAMMQLIADVAPGADQAFHTAFNGMADFATGIVELATVAGSDVIVDDVFYYAEPMFQDGIVAQAADTVVGMGVPYFSSAGNGARKSYESPYVPSGIAPFGGTNYHDFDSGAGVDVYQNVTIPVGARVIFVLQWDEPFFSVSGAPGSTNDVDICLFNDPPTTFLACGANNNIGSDPIEIFNYTNPGPATSYNILIDRFSGSNPGLMKYIYYGNMTINEYDTASSTVTGHSNAAGAEAVGAAFYDDTPEFGTNPALLEPFSSAGPTPILFTVAGVPTNVLRQKPEIVAPDGTNNTFFGFDVEPDGFPNFFGTSAAAPHAAAVAALMIEASGGALSPAGVYTALESTAADMLTPGFDNDSGYGLVQADLAVGAVIPSPEADLEISKVDDVDPVVAGNQLIYTVIVRNNGPDSAANVKVTDTLPVGVSFFSSPSCTEVGGIVTCNLGTLASGASTSVFIVVNVHPGTSGIISNLATVSTTTTDPNPLNDDTSEKTIVTAPGKDDTTTKLTSSQNPSVHGQAVTFTATVTPATSGLPTGSVTFKDGTTVLGTDTLDGAGKATYTSSMLTVSTHTITAEYSGDSNFNASNDSLSQMVNKAGTKTVVTSSANPSTVGQAVTFTATVTAVAPGTGTPTGTITFKDGVTVLDAVTVDGAGKATLISNNLTIGTHTITAEYSGDSSFNTSSDSLSQMVNKADTTTAVTSSANPSPVGQAITFTAMVTAVAPGSGTPTGTITFKDGVTVLDAVTVDGAGQAAFISNNLTIGTHTITAEYSGDGNFNASSGTVVPDQIVNGQFTIALPVVLKGP